MTPSGSLLLTTHSLFVLMHWNMQTLCFHKSARRVPCLDPCAFWLQILITGFDFKLLHTFGKLTQVTPSTDLVTNFASLYSGEGLLGPV